MAASERIAALCRQIGGIAATEGLTRFELASNVLELVQREIEYAYDEESTDSFPGGPHSEYGRFPIETIFDRHGDCECTSILCASLLACLGFRTALLHVSITDPDDGDVSHHVAVGLDPSGIFVGNGDLGTSIDALDTIRDPKGGEGYLYGETAIDGSTRGFGEIPPDWAPYMTVRRVSPIPAEGAGGA
jgi:hypothetical protein